MKIIPAIDIIGGKCVRLTQGNYGQCKIYSANPLEMARLFEEAGLDRLHLVDLDGAKASGVVNWAVLETICKHTRLSIDFGGGVKTDEDMRRVFEAGLIMLVLAVSLRQIPNKPLNGWKNVGMKE
ncbi:MAG: HisA/HisF-related TIM barrel protein [Odoribacter splanchnicus]